MTYMYYNRLVLLIIFIENRERYSSSLFWELFAFDTTTGYSSVLYLQVQLLDGLSQLQRKLSLLFQSVFLGLRDLFLLLYYGFHELFLLMEGGRCLAGGLNLVYTLSKFMFWSSAFLHSYLSLELGWLILLSSLGAWSIAFLTSLDYKPSRSRSCRGLLSFLAWRCLFILLLHGDFVLLSNSIPDFLEELCLTEGPWKCGLTLIDNRALSTLFWLHFELFDLYNATTFSVRCRR